MNSDQVVSVMMPVFNGEATVGMALNSLLCQTWQGWEAIVVDDGSTDGTIEIVEDFADPRIKVFQLRENRGRGFARQYALDRCRGEFLAMLDADDWYYPSKLEKQLEVFGEHPDLMLVSSAMASVDSRGELRGILGRMPGEEDVVISPPLTSLFRLTMPHAPSMIRARPARAISYDCRLKRSEEFHFLARLLAGGRNLVMREVLYAYTDVASFFREGAFARYHWSARASIKLFPRFRWTALFFSTRSILQACFALVFGGLRVGARVQPVTPSNNEENEFISARAQIENAIALGVGAKYSRPDRGEISALS